MISLGKVSHHVVPRWEVGLKHCKVIVRSRSTVCIDPGALTTSNAPFITRDVSANPNSWFSTGSPATKNKTYKKMDYITSSVVILRLG